MFLGKVFLSLIHTIYLTKFLNLWILNSTFLTADLKTGTKCQYRNVTVLTVDVTHGIATTKRNITLTSFDVVSTLLFYFYFFLKCLR